MQLDIKPRVWFKVQILKRDFGSLMHVQWEGVLLNHLSKKGRKPSFVAFANSRGVLTPTMADWKLPTVSQLIHRIPDNLIIGSCELAQARLQHMMLCNAGGARGEVHLTQLWGLICRISEKWAINSFYFGPWSCWPSPFFLNISFFFFFFGSLVVHFLGFSEIPSYPSNILLLAQDDSCWPSL